MQLNDLINLAIAIFTALAAKAAWDSAKASRLAVEQANESAEDSRKIAKEQTKALMTAAKANALASRINFYNEQIAEARGAINKAQGAPVPNRPFISHSESALDELIIQRDHYAWFLDRQSNELEVGLRHTCPGSPYNKEVPRWRGDIPETNEG
jgi:hypothetical protein